MSGGAVVDLRAVKGCSYVTPVDVDAGNDGD